MPPLNKLKIHQPLPLNPRESKQLLNLLTTSFRQQLETEHGEFAARTAPRKPAHHENQRLRRRSMLDSWRNPTDHHMHSLLTNPLFNYSPDKASSESARDPMHIFDQAVAKGMMSTDYARVCLTVKKRDIVQSSVLNVRDGMRDSGAGLKVLRWLISSGTTNTLDFLKDEQFATILMEYMVAEGLQEAAWAWVKKAFEGVPGLHALEGAAWPKTRREIVRPLMALIKAETVGSVSLDSAYICLSRAAGYLKGLPSADLRAVLGPAGWFLAHQTTMSNSDHPPPSETNFESFLSLVPVISKYADLYFAHLNLIHPTKPSAELALAYLRDISTKRDQASTERNHIQLSLDTAKFLLENDRSTDGEWVMDLLQTKYPKQLGLKQRKQLDQAKAEASSLELLESLSFA